MVRPMLPEADRRSEAVFAMVKPSEKLRIMRRASELDVSGSAFMRSAVLRLLDQPAPVPALWLWPI